MMKEKNIFQLLSDAIERGRSVSLVTVISADGSTPRDAGAKMLVYENGEIEGTVGGGKPEHLAIVEAKKALKDGVNRRIALDLTPEGVGALCMGRIELFIEVFAQPFKLLIVGAGHVGLKIARAASVAGISYSVADDRTEFANRERFPDAAEIINAKPDKALRKAAVDQKTCVIIVTRGHAHDRECLEEAIKTKAAYIGMIGSRHKVPAVFKKINKKGLHPENDPRVFAPIGLDLGGKTPGAIAISVIAEILKVCHKKDAGHMRDIKILIPLKNPYLKSTKVKKPPSDLK